MQTGAAKHALVIGGSMSGLLTARALRLRGWTVDVFERVESELAGRGAGIVVQPRLRRVLEAVGIDPNTDWGVGIAFRQVLDRAGAVIARRNYPQTVTSWDHLYRLLREGFPPAHYHRGKTLKHVEADTRSVRAHFADGSTAQGDVLIGADGLRSTVREQYLPKFMPRYAGYVAWRGLVPEPDIPASTHRDLFSSLSFCLPAGEQMLGYPVAGTHNDLRLGARRYNFVWYRAAEESTALHQLLIGNDGITYSVSIPPPLIRAEPIAAMRDAAKQNLSPQFQEIIRLVRQPFLQPIYDLDIPNMVFGRVAVLGDAAFVARPHIGAGIAKAAEDAIALADALQNGADIETGLRRFEEIRLPIDKRIVQHASDIGTYLQSSITSEKERMLAERYAPPEAVLAETALLDFLEA